MPTYKAGQEVDAFCTKCKMDLLHKIVAVVGGKPVRVECRTCHTTHQYRAVKGVKSPGAAPPVKPTPTPKNAPSGSASSGSTTASRRKAAVEDGPLVAPAGAAIRQYKPSEKFGADHWIQHKMFGIGHVLREIPPDKIEVRFDAGHKVLIHGKGES